MELQWLPNTNLSSLHTAWCLSHFPQAATACEDALRESAAGLDALPGSFSVPRDRFWEQLLALAPSVDFSGDLAQRLMVRLGLRAESQRSRLAAAVQDCRRHFEHSFPRYQAEARLRTGPMQQMWQAQGPGLLRILGRLSEPELLVEQAQVVVVQPILGGMGFAHLSTNRVHIEGLLTHADPQLPETLRLAWLLGQLDLERPVYSELIHASRLRCLAGLALLPAVLQAGQELDLCLVSPASMAQAIALWRVDTLQHPPLAAAHIVHSWWETYQHSRPQWRIALTGLDRLLLA
ncbi:MAG: hypothetical protein KDA45_06400 [Planctomycetales bacterium]|nr:hypothetical protein [Planctomycetales bacterium]